MSDVEASAPLGPEEPAAVALGEDPDDGDLLGDEQEWEYEYSTTETETYYLTVELSYPEFKTPLKPQGLHSTRGGHYKTWLGQANGPGEASGSSTAAKRADAASREHQPAGGTENEDEEDEDEPVPAAEADDDDDNLDIDPSLMNQTYDMDAERRESEKEQTGRQRRERERSNESDQDADEAVLQPMQDIQVLDLHSKRPFISYRGRIFEGEWAEVVGTELILMDDDEKNDNLPRLRTMPGVSLLAASASRILTTEKTIKPKQPEEDPLAEIRKEWLINVPPGVDKTGERAQQASFLEKLIGLKLKRGEADEVTVHAKEAIGKNFKDFRDPTSRPRRKMLNEDEELDDDGRPVAKKPRRRLPGRRRRGSGRASGSVQVRGLPERTLLDERLSVPTPGQWSELTGNYEDEDEDEDDDDEDVEDDEDEDDEDMDGTSDNMYSLEENDDEDEVDEGDTNDGQDLAASQHDNDEYNEGNKNERLGDLDRGTSHTKRNDPGKAQDVVMRDSG